MQLHVLGSAAGGGVPQWNCGCSNCTAAREQRLPSRTQASIAASADGRRWVLFNATTDVGTQLARDPALAPHGLRDSPIEAIFLTDANVDHSAGLLEFRQAGELRVHSTAPVRDTLTANPMFAPFARAPRTWEAVEAMRTVDVAGLHVTPVPVTGLLPAFAGGAKVDGAAIAFLIEDAAGGAALYAPVFLEGSCELWHAADAVEAAFFDGSFWSDDELVALGLGGRTARAMGHSPVDGAGGSLPFVRGARCARKYYTHVNNTNPLLDPASMQAAALSDAGIALAKDGEALVLEGSASRARAGA